MRPVHFALLKASEIRDNFYQVQQEFEWARGIRPTPCWCPALENRRHRTVLAYGAHGPKDLVVLILEDQ